MKIFISWSGPTSQHIANALRDWLPMVLQTVEVFVSSEDIDKGARWSSEIALRLEETNYGILCLTPDNIRSPWLNFEAGALSKSVQDARIMPLLHGLTPSQVPPPLGTFQSTVSGDEADILRLVQSINTALASPLSTENVAKIVRRWYPDLKASLDEAPVPVSPPSPTTVKPVRPERDMIEELLALTRQLKRDLLDSTPIIHDFERTPSGGTRRIYAQRQVETLFSQAASYKVTGISYTEDDDTLRVRIVDGPIDRKLSDALALVADKVKIRIFVVDEHGRILLAI